MIRELYEQLKRISILRPRVKESTDRRERTKMVIEMKVTQSQGLALQAMFEYWDYLASVGGSRKVAFYVDGDGNFKPNCNVQFETNVQLTDEMRQISIVEDNNGDRTYDFDPIAWKLHDLEESKKDMG